MKKYLAVLLALVVLTLSAPPAEASHLKRVEVMSQNLYIGADLSRLLTGEATPADLLATVEATNYPARAVEIAQGIDDFNPDLIGLQEATLITIFTFDPNGNVVVLQQEDYLQILMDELAIVDHRYEVAASVNNADITLPIDLENNIFGRVIDRDVVLYRNTTTSIDPHSIETGHFAATFTPSFAGVEIPFLRGYVALDVEVHGLDYRFVNTHLEVSAADGGLCVTEDGNVFACQDAQAAELVEIMADDGLPTIVAGDFNAEPTDPAYGILLDDGHYTDTWSIRYPSPQESGVTCCQSETLDNVENQLSQRIDHIFIENSIHPVFTQTTVVGDWEERKTETDPPLWYSDHGGPFARLYIAS